MSLAAALPIVLVTAASAAGDLEVGFRTSARSSVLSPSSSPAMQRAEVTAEPRVGAVVEGQAIRTEAGYGLQLSTLDVGAISSPAINQLARLRLQDRGESWVRGELSASGSRMKSEPLTDAASVAGTGGAQVASTAPIQSESLQAAAKGELVFDRGSVITSGSWSGSRGVDARSRALLPPQQTVGIDLGGTYAATERDRIGLDFAASRTLTSTAGESATSTVVVGTTRWYRSLSPTTSGSVAVGAAIGEEQAPRRTVTSPAVDLALEHLTSVLKLRAWAQLSMFVDRFTGATSPMSGAGCTGAWNPVEQLSLAVSISGGARLDGATSFAAADVHAAWTIRPKVSFEAGVLARNQHDTRPQQPSFEEAGLYFAVSYASGPFFGAR